MTEINETNKSLTLQFTAGEIDSETFLKQRNTLNHADIHPYRTYFYDTFKAVISEWTASRKTELTAKDSL